MRKIKRDKKRMSDIRREKDGGGGILHFKRFAKLSFFNVHLLNCKGLGVQGSYNIFKMIPPPF